MALTGETPRSLRLWFGLAGGLHLLGGLVLLAVLRGAPVWVPLYNLLVLAVGGALIWVAVKLPDLLRTRSKLPARLLIAILTMRAVSAALNMESGLPFGRVAPGLIFGTVFVGYLWYQLKAVQEEVAEDAPAP